MIRKACIIMLLGLQLPCLAAEGTLTLVSEGQPTATIVVAPDAPAIDRRAADVLQDYVARISGAKLPIATATEGDGTAGTTAIRIGRAAEIWKAEAGNTEAGNAEAGNAETRDTGSWAAPTGDAYRLRVVGNQLLIQGGRVTPEGSGTPEAPGEPGEEPGEPGKGVLYGVYTLLETYFGCRKLDGGPAWVPRRATVEVPASLDLQEIPPLVYRESFYPAAMDNEYLDWHKLHRFEDLWGLWGHSFFALVPPADHFDAHPEYYALVDGRRQPTQLCLSNPDVVALVARNLRERMAAAPDATYWSIAPMDGGGFCTCDDCRRADAEAGGPQGSLIRFVNRIATQMPDKKFTTLAYMDTADPPRHTRPAPNVYIMLSSIDAQRQEPLRTAPTAEAFRSRLAGWGKLTDNLFVWDYTTQFTNYLAPFPDDQHLQPNIDYLAEQQVKGVFEQGSGYTYGDLAELKSYVLAKALWNPKVDAEAVSRDFIQHYYGAAAEAVSDYLAALHTAVAETGATLDIYGNPVNNRTDYLSPERMDVYSTLLDRAEAATEAAKATEAAEAPTTAEAAAAAEAAEHPPFAERVARLRLGLEYTVLQQARLFGRGRYGYLTGGDHPMAGRTTGAPTIAVKAGWRSRITRFVDAATRAGVTELSEGGPTPAAYGEAWETLLHTGWIPGKSVDRPVTLAHPFVADYPARQEATLTDGIAGGLDYSYNWLLFEAADLEATIDLGKAMPIHEVLLNYLDDPRHYLFAPSGVTVAVSRDGKKFVEIGDVGGGRGNFGAGASASASASASDADRPALGDAPAARHTVSIPAHSRRARYVRVTAHCPATLPPTFTGSRRRKPMIAIDEVTVR